MRIGALTECEERTGLSQDERQQQGKERKRQANILWKCRIVWRMTWDIEWGWLSGSQQICRAELRAPGLGASYSAARMKKQGMGHLTSPQQAGEWDTFSA